MAGKQHWENLVDRLLGDDSPCIICAVRAMCRKSFVTRSGGGCPELKEAIQNALREKHGVKKDED